MYDYDYKNLVEIALITNIRVCVCMYVCMYLCYVWFVCTYVCISLIACVNLINK